MAKEKSSKKKNKGDEDEEKVLCSKGRKMNGKRYALFESKFKGNATIGLYEVNKDKTPVRDFPLVAMGVAKATILCAFSKELKAFADKLPWDSE